MNTTATVTVPTDVAYTDKIDKHIQRTFDCTFKIWRKRPSGGTTTLEVSSPRADAIAAEIARVFGG